MSTRRRRGETGKLSAGVATLADVARAAGVSTATVSRCLNQPEQVVEATRRKVLDVVQQLNYAPNFSARALAAKRTFTVGAVIPTMDNAIFARGIQAFQEALAWHGITLLVASSAYRPEVESEQIRTLVARGADGLLLIGYDREPAIYDFLQQRRVPAVVTWAHDPGQPQTAIGFDNIAAMAALTREVLARGHRRIAMISAPTDANDRARGRVAGARLALDEAGLDAAAMPVIETDYGVETGAEAFHRLIAEHPGTTAVLCGNDVLAMGAMRAAKARGLSVPRDVSITGFDDTELAMLAEPPLTTVHVPHREMGRNAAELLVAMIEGKPHPERIELPTDIRLRDSLGPPRP